VRARRSLGQSACTHRRIARCGASPRGGIRDRSAAAARRGGGWERGGGWRGRGARGARSRGVSALAAAGDWHGCAEAGARGGGGALDGLGAAGAAVDGGGRHPGSEWRGAALAGGRCRGWEEVTGCLIYVGAVLLSASRFSALYLCSVVTLYGI